MTRLVEWKLRILRFVSENEAYLRYIWKFIVALSLFGIINTRIAFVEELSSAWVAIALSLLCGFLPLEITLLIGAILILVHLSVLSVEVAMITFLVFGIIVFVYFRFSPHDIMLFAMTPVLWSMGIPYVLPIAAGLLRKGHSVVSLIGATIVYHFLDGIYKNVSVFQATAVGEDLAGAKIAVTVKQIFDNEELLLVIIVFTISTVMVNVIRKMAIQHAWKIAIVVGVLIQVTCLLIGYIFLNITSEMIGMLLGNIFAVAVGFIIEFFFMDLDYSRVERVQFEDDEYYYFVKAIPKKKVTSSEKTITEFNEIKK